MIIYSLLIFSLLENAISCSGFQRIQSLSLKHLALEDPRTEEEIIIL